MRTQAAMMTASLSRVQQHQSVNVHYSS